MPPSLGKLEDVTGLYQEVRAEKRELEEKVTVLTKAQFVTVLTKAHTTHSAD